MGYIIIAIISGAILLAVVIIALVQFINKKRSYSYAEKKSLPALKEDKDERLDEFAIQIGTFPIEEFPETNLLVEITDKTLLKKVFDLAPTLAEATSKIVKSVNGGEVLYKAILPPGASLVKSQNMAGAFRGFARDSQGIVVHADFVPVSGASQVLSAINPALVSSMVVVQYYLKKIDKEIGEIHAGLDAIASFQNNEYRSRVFALLNQLERISEFQSEIVSNDEQRRSTIIQLNSLEQTCIELLGQADETIVVYTRKTDLKYEDYEKALKEAQDWFIYQNSLAYALCKISELKYALYLGSVSRDFCQGLLPKYSEQVKESKKRLAKWHEDSMERLGIDVENKKRKRNGLVGLIYRIPGLFNDKWNYKDISSDTASIITIQISSSVIDMKNDDSELYQDQVELIYKDDKVYYYPKIDKKDE